MHTAIPHCCKHGLWTGLDWLRWPLPNMNCAVHWTISTIVRSEYSTWAVKSYAGQCEHWQVIQLSQSTETAEKNLWEMESGTLKTEGVNQLTDKSTLNGDGNCFRCWKSGHSGATCLFRNRVCHKCKRRGPIARVCKNKGSFRPPTRKF